MKTKWTLAFTFVGALAAAGAVALAGTSHKSGLVVHEWGTFTSVQGADGVPLNWKPLATSELPDFVYSWTHPGLQRINFSLLGGKGGMTSLQRMETPVIYFYSDKPLTADVSVAFPRGLITEWFPQAPQIGPSVCGAAAKTLTNSFIHWPDIHVLAADVHETASLPTDTNGTHYFAARETDANVLRLDSFSTNQPGSQSEKFLFYRGVGNFPTPLRVTMKSDDAVTICNTGSVPLKHLFVLDVKDKSGGFIYVPELLPGEEKAVSRVSPDKFLAPPNLATALSKSMSQALVKEGLYSREAAAMVNTWKSSWFTEDGTRVLYVLPRAWTDRTLPMTLNPSPRELTRVMVGRAEIMTPVLERNLAQQLDRARGGDPAAVAQLRQTAKSLGRFSEPAFYRSMTAAKRPAQEQNKLAELFFDWKHVNAGQDFE